MNSHNCKRRIAAALLAAAIATLGACHRHDEPAGKPAKAAQHEDEHAHGGGGAITHYTDATELFVEFPALVKNEEAAFAAHVTRLPGFKALAAGTLTVILSGNQQPEERAQAGISPTPGIFRPVMKPTQSGRRQLAIEISAPGIAVTHALGEVEVFASHEAAHAAAAGAGEDKGIKFTKEQQWQLDFANTPATARELRESVAVLATLRPRASGEAQIAAPGAGLLRAAPGGFPQVGMSVAAGQVLAMLSPRLGGDSDFASLGLAVRRAQIEAQRATVDRERLEGLLTIEAIPAKRVLDARSREDLAQAELRSAEQRAATWQGGGGGIALKSPIAGTVVAVNAIPGAAVSEGQALVHVADLARLWLEARVPESAVSRIEKPTGVFFRTDGAGEATVLEAGRNAKLVAFGGMVDATTRTVPAIFEFDNRGGALRAGMNVQASVYTGRVIKGVAVPASALVDDGGVAVVFVQTGGELFERRVVQPGTRDGEWVGIPSGVAPGERVVTRGAYQVRLAALQPAAVGHGHAH